MNERKGEREGKNKQKKLEVNCSRDIDRCTMRSVYECITMLRTSVTTTSRTGPSRAAVV